MRKLSVKELVKMLENKREFQNREIDAELAKLRVLCEHTNTQSYPPRAGDASTECKDCGEWW